MGDFIENINKKALAGVDLANGKDKTVYFKCGSRVGKENQDKPNPEWRECEEGEVVGGGINNGREFRFVIRNGKQEIEYLDENPSL